MRRWSVFLLSPLLCSSIGATARELPAGNGGDFPRLSAIQARIDVPAPHRAKSQFVDYTYRPCLQNMRCICSQLMYDPSTQNIYCATWEECKTGTNNEGWSCSYNPNDPTTCQSWHNLDCTCSYPDCGA